MVADGESAELARRLIADTCGKQAVEPGQLTIHADRGSSMTSKPVAFLMADLGVTKTHSRPCLRRQPVFGKPFPDSEIPARLPGTLRIAAGCPSLRTGVLRLVQRAAPAFRHRAACPRRSSSWPRPCRHRATAGHSDRRLCEPPGTLRRRATTAAGRAGGGLDQQTTVHGK